MMYPVPNALPRLPQGDYSVTPQVRCFPEETDPIVLNVSINTWILTAVPLVDLWWEIIDVKYVSAQKSNNVVVYSALVHYLIISRI